MSFRYIRLLSTETNSDSISDINSEPMDQNENQWVTDGEEGRTGLDNLGNTCFMNAVVQCLSCTDPFRQYFISNDFEKDINEANPYSSHGMTAYTFALLLRHMWSNKSTSIKPNKLRQLVSASPLGLSGYGQHDAHELCAFLLDSLHEDLNRIRVQTNVRQLIEDENEVNEQKLANQSWNQFKALNDSIVIDLFYGQYLSSIRCSLCPKVSIKFDPFAFLSLPIPNNYNTIDLEDCLKLYTTPERLTQQDSWYCPQCKQPREATKQMSLWRLPNILVIQLKRFYFDNHMCAEKISSFVSFPIRGLDLSPYCSQTNRMNINSIYDLYGVVNHYGGVSGGHYTAYAKSSHNYKSSGWRCFDDNNVDDMNEHSVVTRYAYLLFYRRRDTKYKF